MQAVFLLTDKPIISLDPKKLIDHPLNIELFGDLSNDEYESLKNDIDSRGIQDPLHVVKKGKGKYLVVSGHQRKKIAIDLNRNKKKKIDVPCIVRDDLKEDWQIEEQLISDNLLRRHLKDWQIPPIAEHQEKIEIQKAKQRQGTRTDLKKKDNIPEKFRESKHKREATAKVAKQFGKSGRQYEKIKKVYEDAPKKVKKQWKQGEISTHRAWLETTGKDKGMSKHNRKVLFSSKHDNWETPKALYNTLNKEFNFDFDPCPLNATFDGLNIDWKQKNFVNPPYSNINSFLEKAHKEIKNKNSSLHIFLIPVRTDTKWFHTHIYPFYKKKIGGLKIDIRFIKGRLKFTNGNETKHSAPFPSMICIFKGGGNESG